MDKLIIFRTKNCLGSLFVVNRYYNYYYYYYYALKSNAYFCSKTCESDCSVVAIIIVLLRYYVFLIHVSFNLFLNWCVCACVCVLLFLRVRSAALTWQCLSITLKRS